MKILTSIKTALVNLAALAWDLLPSAALDAVPSSSLMVRYPAATKGISRPDGAKLARKAAKGLVGVARIK